MAKPRKGDREKAEKYERAKMLARERARRYKARKSEEQLEKKREQDRKSAEERRKHVKDMTEKEKKLVRKQWRDRKRQLRKRNKEQEEMLQNTPPSSEDEANEVGISEKRGSRQNETGKKIARRNRVQMIKELKKAKEENKKLQQKLEKYKKRLLREKNKKPSTTSVSPSPRKKLLEIVGTERVSPNVKKQLFAGLVLEKQVKTQVRSTSSKSKSRQMITKAIGNNILKKYRQQKMYQSLVPYTYNRVLSQSNPSRPTEYDRKQYETVKIKESLAIRHFYEDDMTSRMMPGKKDYIKKGHIKKQKRVLLDSLYNLYDKFVEDTGIKNVSRSVFYKCRPWWIYRPQMKDRETCACVRHENIEFLVSALKNAKVVSYKNVDEVIKSTVCSFKNENCMMSLCPNCKQNTFQYELGDDDEQIKFYKWEIIKENKTIKGVDKVIKHTQKTSLIEKKSVIVNLLKNGLTPFKKHVFNMNHQAKVLKTLKEYPKCYEILYQVDFSQNYIAKFASEVQSVHFGASQKQISLHTGARYIKKQDSNDVICSTFCTISDILDHHAHGVWSHLKPILTNAKNDFPDTKAVHFFSDSPSSQYRNKTNVFLMKELLPQYFKNLESFTWNFSESGHGKGVMDGVGGAIKRNTDLHVLHQKDVSCAKDIVTLLSNSKIKIAEISSETFEEVKSLIPSKIDPINGIMCVRQITWSKITGILNFRKLSCFECSPDQKCKHYHLFSIGTNGKLISSKQTKPRPKKIVHQKRTVLKVSDVYTSGEDEPEECVQLKTNFGFDDLKQGRFIVVTFETGKKKSTKEYVAVIQNEEGLEERELNVMFLKKYHNDNSMFFPDENDESYISVDKIKGVLPTPEIMFKGDRLYHKFSGPVCLRT